MARDLKSGEVRTTMILSEENHARLTKLGKQEVKIGGVNATEVLLYGLTDEQILAAFRVGIVEYKRRGGMSLDEVKEKRKNAMSVALKRRNEILKKLDGLSKEELKRLGLD